MNFCRKLKALRGQHGFKQSDLADKAGLTSNKVQRYEQSSQKPKGDDALALARALGVSADYLLDDSLPFPPPQEHLSEKVAIISRLEGLIGALLSRDGEPHTPTSELPDVVRLPVFKLGAGFDVSFDAVGMPTGEKVGDGFFDRLGEGKFFAAELHGASMRTSGGLGFSLGEIVVFRVAEPCEVASGDHAYVRTEDRGLFRQVFLHGNQFRLRALNPADPEIAVETSEIQQVCRLVRRVKDY